MLGLFKIDKIGMVKMSVIFPINASHFLSFCTAIVFNIFTLFLLISLERSSVARGKSAISTQEVTVMQDLFSLLCFVLPLPLLLSFSAAESFVLPGQQGFAYKEMKRWGF